MKTTSAQNPLTTELSPLNMLDIIKEGVSVAFKELAEAQRILALPYITTKEAATVYPVGKSTLEKMRMQRTGPKFFYLTDADKPTPLYTHKDIQDWLKSRPQKVL